MINELVIIRSNFDESMENVRNLMEFDIETFNFCLKQLENLQLKWMSPATPAILTNELTKTINALKNIRTHESYKEKYHAIYNQCIVLVVSHFSSTIHALYICTYNLFIKNKISPVESKITITYDEILKLEEDLNVNWGEAFTNQKKDISFQDMKSLKRGFLNTFIIDIGNVDETQEIIIIAEALRHAIVHNGSKIDDHLLNQIKEVNKSLLTTSNDLHLGNDILFDYKDIPLIIDAMGVFISNLSDLIEERINR